MRGDMALVTARRRLAHAHAAVSTLTLAAMAIHHLAAGRLMRAGDPMPLPAVPAVEDAE
ncbi:hypothetical protein [Roseomonas populi]|uniref:DUF305 domain-containing protein n=1 Tax=Roseomonas populi TaxID=3121582 RepID=A0ABT1X0V7_9PROT|nr:hypothetical protein [Roseomonas pecuniae]MCR0980807.1 hypothetical protein [Roseomonas pecuniae]